MALRAVIALEAFVFQDTKHHTLENLQGVQIPEDLSLLTMASPTLLQSVYL